MIDGGYAKKVNQPYKTAISGIKPNGATSSFETAAVYYRLRNGSKSQSLITLHQLQKLKDIGLTTDSLDDGLMANLELQIDSLDKLHETERWWNSQSENNSIKILSTKEYSNEELSQKYMSNRIKQAEVDIELSN